MLHIQNQHLCSDELQNGRHTSTLHSSMHTLSPRMEVLDSRDSLSSGDAAQEHAMLLHRSTWSKTSDALEVLAERADALLSTIPSVLHYRVCQKRCAGWFAVLEVIRGVESRCRRAGQGSAPDGDVGPKACKRFPTRLPNLSTVYGRPQRRGVRRESK